MTPENVFFLDVLLAALICIVVVMYVKNHLRSLLIELCGTAERASFWLAFCNVALVLVPLIFALSYEPEAAPGKGVIFEMAGQLKYALTGFVGTLSVFALALLRYIPRDSSTAAANPSREVMR